MFCTWNVGDMFHRRYPKKRNTQHKSIVLWRCGNFAASLAEKPVIIQHVMRHCRRGSSHYPVASVRRSDWNWRWTGTLCGGNIHRRNQYHASASDRTFPVLSVCTGITVNAQKKTQRYHSIYPVSAGSISHFVDFIRQWKKKCYLPASYTIEAAVIVPMILVIFCTFITVSYELYDKVKLAAEESSKNKIECMEEIYIGDML